jgi:iron-sulfur cluster assembly protein
MAELTQLGANSAAAELASAAATPTKHIDVTPKAVQKIREAFAREKVDGGLRLGVLGGGCSGLSYQFKFAQAARPQDHVFQFDDDVRVFVDPKSMLFLDGMTLDWKDSLIQSGFVFNNPHATKSCGCGSSFSS